MPRSSFSVPLPPSWPKHAETATLHVISLAHFVLTHVRGWAANSPIHRVRLSAERDRLDTEFATLREEIRIKDARMAALAPHRRPHYPPAERMAILQIMAARAWSKAQAGRRFLVTDDIAASWSGRLEEDEPGALVKATVIALIKSEDIARKILTAMHLPSEVPKLHPARPPPGSPGVDGGEQQAGESWLN